MVSINNYHLNVSLRTLEIRLGISIRKYNIYLCVTISICPGWYSLVIYLTHDILHFLNIWREATKLYMV